MLQIEDFNRQERGRRTFDEWTHSTGFDTAIGRFDIRCSVPIGVTPDAAMLSALEPLITFVTARTQSVLQAAHAGYLLACQDAAWMQELGLPIGLAAEEIPPLLQFRSVCGDHCFADESEPDSRKPYIHLVPAWDEEHSLFLLVRGDVVERFDW